MNQKGVKMNSFYKSFWTARAGHSAKENGSTEAVTQSVDFESSKAVSKEVLSALSELGYKESSSHEEVERSEDSDAKQEIGFDNETSRKCEASLGSFSDDQKNLVETPSGVVDPTEHIADRFEEQRSEQAIQSNFVVPPKEGHMEDSVMDISAAVDVEDSKQTNDPTISEGLNKAVVLEDKNLVEGPPLGFSEEIGAKDAPKNSSEGSKLNIANLGKRLMMNTIAKNSLHLAANGKEYAPQEDSPLYATEKMLYDAQKSIALNEELIEAGKVTTQVCETVTFKGDIFFNGNGGSIAGIIEGNIVVEGHGVLYLAPSSQVRGNIKARNIIAEGKINGNIVCERVIATSTAVLIGDVMYKDVFNPAPGAKVQGSLQSNPDVFSDDSVKAPEQHKVALGTV